MVSGCGGGGRSGGGGGGRAGGGGGGGGMLGESEGGESNTEGGEVSNIIHGAGFGSAASKGGVVAPSAAPGTHEAAPSSCHPALSPGKFIASCGAAGGEGATASPPR